MSPDHESFADWDAAYVLGALGPADRHAYEQHLEGCERCRAAVAEVSAIPGLLAAARPIVEPAVEPADEAAPLGPPADLVERVTARFQRRTRRRIALGLAGAVTAAAAAAAIVIPLIVTSPAGPTVTVALDQVADTTMTAAVEFTSVDWGTRIGMECDYTSYALSASRGTWEYALVVIDDAGESSEVSTWSAVPGRTIHVDAATAIPLDEIAAIEVRSPSGERILAADVGG